MARNILSVSVLSLILYVLVCVSGVYSQMTGRCLAGEEILGIPYNGDCRTGDCVAKMNRLVPPIGTRLRRTTCESWRSCKGCYERIPPSTPPAPSECNPGDEVIRLPFAGTCFECEAKLRRKATKHFTLWRFMCLNFVSCEGCYTRNQPSLPSSLPPPPPPSPSTPPPRSPTPPPPHSRPLLPPTPSSMSPPRNKPPPPPSIPPPPPSNSPPLPSPTTPSSPLRSSAPPFLLSTPPPTFPSPSNFTCGHISLILKSCESCDVCVRELSKNQPRGTFISNFACNNVGGSIICEGCYGELSRARSGWDSSFCPEEMILRTPSRPEKKRCRYKLAQYTS